jgi:Fe-S-cluster containining protein
MAICISYSDIVRWQKEKRNDILREVSYAKGFPGGNGFYFAKTVKGPVKQQCPFLEKQDGLFSCSIQMTKPIGCDDFPIGFNNPKDCSRWNESMKNPKKIKEVQKRHRKDFRKAEICFILLFDIISKARKIR